MRYFGLQSYGDGYKDHNTVTWARYKFYIDLIHERRTDGQVLCANCHKIKTLEDREEKKKTRAVG